VKSPRGLIGCVVAGLVIGGVLTAHVAGASTATPAATPGRVSVFAHIGQPGYPALSLVAPHRVYVSTFTGAASGSTAPSKVFAYSRRGHLERTYRVRRETPGTDHAVQVAARDRQGRLYLLDQKPARVVRLDPRTGRQSTYATFADVPTCQATGRDSGCSNSVTDNPPEPDYAAWLPDGSMIVTDYAQQLLWRVPPGGGKAKIWLNDARFDGEQFGPAGIVLLPGRRSLLVTDAAGGLTPRGGNDATSGRLYRIRINAADAATRIQQVWVSARGDAPDGFAVSRSGDVVVALAGPSANDVVELAPRRHGNWRQVWRVPSATGAAQPVPWDTPTSVQFLGHRLLVTNQAYFTGDSSHWAVFSIRTGQRGARIFRPARRRTR
jgi:sugar lactone lactonase YvrE